MTSPLVDDAARGFEYDLAHAGFTFAHEFSHAIHVNGRTYDENGNVNDWWSPGDIRKYDRFITEVNDQYEAFSKKYGFSIDGTLSLSENLADITGLSICEDCLHKYHNDHNMSDSIRNISFQYFYTYYAIQNHQVMNKREMLVQVMTNPHLDLKTRTNVPLSRMKEFRRLYNVCKKDGMYWANTGSIW
jgi:putative endopeptidase